MAPLATLSSFESTYRDVSHARSMVAVLQAAPHLRSVALTCDARRIDDGMCEVAAAFSPLAEKVRSVNLHEPDVMTMRLLAARYTALEDLATTLDDEDSIHTSLATALVAGNRKLSSLVIMGTLYHDVLISVLLARAPNLPPLAVTSLVFVDGIAAGDDDNEDVQNARELDARIADFDIFPVLNLGVSTTVSGRGGGARGGSAARSRGSSQSCISRNIGDGHRTCKEPCRRPARDRRSHDQPCCIVGRRHAGLLLAAFRAARARPARGPREARESLAASSDGLTPSSSSAAFRERSCEVPRLSL
jgi:hypothetical protein